MSISDIPEITVSRVEGDMPFALELDGEYIGVFESDQLILVYMAGFISGFHWKENHGAE